MRITPTPEEISEMTGITIDVVLRARRGERVSEQDRLRILQACREHNELLFGTRPDWWDK